MKRKSSSLHWLVVLALAGLTAASTGCRRGGGPDAGAPPTGEPQALTAEEAEATDDATESVDEVSGFMDNLIDRAADAGFDGNRDVCAGAADCAAALHDRAADLRDRIGDALDRADLVEQDCVALSDNADGSLDISFDGCVFGLFNDTFVDGDVNWSRDVVEGESARVTMHTDGLQVNDVRFAGDYTRDVVFSGNGGGDGVIADIHVDGTFDGPNHSADVVGDASASFADGCRTLNADWSIDVDGGDKTLDVSIADLRRCDLGRDCPTGDIVVTKDGVEHDVNLDGTDVTLDNGDTVRERCNTPRRPDRTVRHHVARHVLHGFMDHLDRHRQVDRLVRLMGDHRRDLASGCGGGDAGGGACDSGSLRDRASAARDAYQQAALELGGQLDGGGCVSTSTDATTGALSITFDACAFENGGLNVDGVLVWDAAVLASDGVTLDVSLSSPGITVNDVAIDGAIEETLSLANKRADSATTFDVNVTTPEQTLSAAGDLAIGVDFLQRCATIDGSVDAVIDGNAVSLSVAGLKVCNEGCPEEGAATLDANGSNVVLGFDGTNQASITVDGIVLPPIDLACE